MANNSILHELARAKTAFQLRAIEAVICAPAHGSKHDQNMQETPMITPDTDTLAGLLDAHRYALNLATALRERLFPDNTGWRPFGTLPLLLTQIDNMTMAIAPPVGARVTGWQPIETAPKDGVTEVLMYDPDLGMAVWPSSSSPWPNVTHWMPLPEPPAALLPAGEGE